MKTRRLGSTDLELSEIGFGTWAAGGGNWKLGWGGQDDDEAIRAIQAALAHGINWIDTAPVYGLGHSESLVAKALAQQRKSVILATKCSLLWDEQGHIRSSLARASVRKECEASLRRLRTDFLDLYQIHWPLDEARLEEGWEAIQELIAEGKVRYAGVSNFTVAQLERLRARGKVACLQPAYSLLRRSVEKELLPYCSQQRIGVVAYSPRASGLLTERFERSRLRPGDWRCESEEFVEPRLSANLELVEGLRPIAQKHGKTVSQLAVAWVLRREEVTAAIVGARNRSQVQDLVGATDWALEEEALVEIERLIARRGDKVPELPIRFT